MPKIQDAFIFYNEIELLEIRLYELAPVVDEFVIVEGAQTFTGQNKPSLFMQNRDRFEAYLPKIRHVIVEDWPEDPNPWAREFHQRNALIRASDHLEDDDLIILSDVDEIPTREAVADMASHPATSFAFQQIFSYFRVDFLRDTPPSPLSACTIAERKRTLRSETATERRTSRLARISETMKGENDSLYIYTEGGWHISYLGDNDFVRNKIRTFSHQEYNHPEFLATIDVERLIAEEADLYNRSTAKWRIADGPITVPHLIAEQPERFAHLFARPSNMPSQSGKS